MCQWLCLFKGELQLVWNLNHVSIRLKMNRAKWHAEFRTLHNSLSFNATDLQEDYVLYFFVHQIWFATEAMQYIFKYLLCHTLLITMNGRAQMERQRLQYPLQSIVRTVEIFRVRLWQLVLNASQCSPFLILESLSWNSSIFQFPSENIFLFNNLR